jgi:hypothetical protein
MLSPEQIVTPFCEDTCLLQCIAPVNVGAGTFEPPPEPLLPRSRPIRKAKEQNK